MIRRRYLYLLCFGALVLFATVASLSASGALTSSAKADVYVYSLDGFDTCGAPTTSQMNTWWTNSGFFNVGIYIGGVNRACPNSNLTASWVTTVHNQGWAFLPIYVGLQDPCWGHGGSMFSTDPTTAKSQGEGSADNAVAAASNLGFGGTAVIYYDLEAYTQTSTCVAAADAFINGFDQELTAQNYVPAVYGSSAGSDLTDLHGVSNSPPNIWAADYNGTNTVWGLYGLSNSLWSYDNRIHQYQGGHNETHGGVTISIDSDCSNGPSDKANSGIAEGNFDTGSTNEADGPSEDPSC